MQTSVPIPVTRHGPDGQKTSIPPYNVPLPKMTEGKLFPKDKWERRANKNAVLIVAGVAAIGLLVHHLGGT